MEENVKNPVKNVKKNKPSKGKTRKLSPLSVSIQELLDAKKEKSAE